MNLSKEAVKGKLHGENHEAPILRSQSLPTLSPKGDLLSPNNISKKEPLKLNNEPHSPANSQSFKVLIGNPVTEGHENYMLMYDMLTGIRISVSRNNAKEKRDLIDKDFSSSHKLAFDQTGNELTPTSKYHFKFKDYSPMVFGNIRDIFKIDASDYLSSLTGKYVLSELGSPGKSGSFFYYSRDYRFIIKTIHHGEHKFLLKILKDYYQHIKANINTLLCRILGLHRVKLPGNKKIHFVIMSNVFPPNKDIHRIYDLKGSSVGRAVSDAEAANPTSVLKDLNWKKNEESLFFGKKKKDLLMAQLEKDVELLRNLRIMDYSLLIGIHDMIKGNKDNIRDNTLAEFQPDDTIFRQRHKRHSLNKKLSVKRSSTHNDISQLAQANLPAETPIEKKDFLFTSDHGGFQASNSNDEDLPILYYLGIIDIFTVYNTKKKVENFFKGLVQSKMEISAVRPDLYAKRFLNFMEEGIKPVERLTNKEENNENSEKPIIVVQESSATLNAVTIEEKVMVKIESKSCSPDDTDMYSGLKIDDMKKIDILERRSSFILSTVDSITV